MREHRYSEAIPYFQNNPWYADSTMPSLKQLAKQFKTISESVRTTSGIDKAEQLFKLSQITRKWGMELTGTELDPDWTLHGGTYSEGDWEYQTDYSKIDRIDSTTYSWIDTIYRQIPISRYQFEPGFATAEEYRRLKATQVVPYRRYHYRWVASDQALEAAHLVSPRSQAFAAYCFTAQGYISNLDHEGSQAIYRYYVRSKPAY